MQQAARSTILNKKQDASIRPPACKGSGLRPHRQEHAQHRPRYNSIKSPEAVFLPTNTQHNEAAPVRPQAGVCRAQPFR